jgi:hypothetical protein|tara:strand:+ start:1517 stop:1666 length:150 start_codon:yes stop_codon:yes gene_type:complete
MDWKALTKNKKFIAAVIALIVGFGVLSTEQGALIADVFISAFEEPVNDD